MAQADRRRPKRLNHLLFHTVAGSQMKLLRGLIVLVNNSTISSGELDRMANDRAEHSLEVESRADRLADFSQRFQFSDRSRQFARPRLQFLEQADVLDGDDRLVGEGLEQRDLLFCRRDGLPCGESESPRRNTFAQQRRGKYGPSTIAVASSGLRELGFDLCREVMHVNCLPVNDGPARRGPRVIRANWPRLAMARMQPPAEAVTIDAIDQRVSRVA